MVALKKKERKKFEQGSHTNAPMPKGCGAQLPGTIAASLSIISVSTVALGILLAECRHMKLGLTFVIKILAKEFPIHSQPHWVESVFCRRNKNFWRTPIAAASSATGVSLGTIDNLEGILFMTVYG